MRLLATLAWRNLFRNPKRTLLTVTAIAFSAAVLMFFMAIQNKSYETGINATTALFHGHGQIQAPGFVDKPRMRLIIRNPAAVDEILSENGHVSAWTPRSIAFSLASTGERSYGAQIIGVDPDREPSVSTIPRSIRAGRYLSSPDGFEAVIGQTLARNLQLDIGDELTILGQGYDGSLATAVLNVVGIFESGSGDLDRGVIEIPLGTFGEVFSMQGAVHIFVFRMTDFEQLDKVLLGIASALQARQVSGVSVLSWEQLLPGLKQSIQLDMSAGWFFFSALIIIVFFSVLNTFLMSVLERTKEFGVVLALGMRPAKLSHLLLVEAVFLGGLGATFGFLLGALVVGLMHIYGFTIPGTEEVRKMWNVPATIFPDLTLMVGIVGPGILFITAVVSGFYPSLKARWLTPIKALRGQL